MNNNVMHTTNSEPTTTFKDIPDEYKDLFVISPQLKAEMKGKSLALMIFEGTIRSINLNLRGKQLSLEFKHSSEKNMEMVIKAKVKEYDQVVKNIALPTLEALFGLIAINGGALKGISHAVTAAVRGATSQLESKQQGEITGLEHTYQSQNQSAEQNRRIQQEAQQIFDQLLGILSKTSDGEHENFKSTASAGG